MSDPADSSGTAGYGGYISQTGSARVAYNIGNNLVSRLLLVGGSFFVGGEGEAAADELATETTELTEEGLEMGAEGALTREAAAVEDGAIFTESGQGEFGFVENLETATAAARGGEMAETAEVATTGAEKIAGQGEQLELGLGESSEAASVSQAGIETSGGSAAKTGVNANRLAGARAVDDFIANAEANGMQVVGRETTFNTPFGARRMDVILLNPQTGSIGGVEVKSSLGAFKCFDADARQQFSADRWINTFGATSVGEQSGITINNTLKILWPAPPEP